MQKFSRTLIALAAAAAFLAALAPAARADISYYTPPKFKHKVLPQYPDAARAAHETGSVIIKVLVAANGTPKQFIIFKSSGHKDLDDAVVTAAKASTYTPAMRGSTPQIAYYDVTYKFTLTGVAQDEGNQSDLAKKLSANPKDVQTRLALGTDYLNQKNYSQAEQVFQTGTQLVPGNAKLWAYLGLAYYQDAQATTNHGNYKPAVDAYDQALKIDPKVDTNNVAAAAYFNYGFHLQQTNDIASAVTYSQKAIALSPKEGQYYILLGELQTSQGDYANAVATLKKAESLDKKDNSIVTSRIIADEANAELSQNDTANGMADIERAKRANGQAPFAYEYLFSYYVKSGKRQAALTPLNQLELLQPKEVNWPLQIGGIYLGLNNVAAAKEAYLKAQSIAPGNPDVEFGMARVAVANGDTTAVASTMQKITSGVDPKQAALYESIIAIDLLNASQNSKTDFSGDAKKYADAATKADPNNAEAWYALGVSEAKTNKDDAKFALKKAYDIFKQQNNQDGMKQVADLFKQISGSDISGYTYGRDEKTNQPGH